MHYLNFIKSYFISVIFVVGMLTSQFLKAQPNWQIDPGNFQYSMTVTSLLEINGDTLESNNDRIAAFFNGEVRGVTSPTVYIASLDRHLAFLTVFSNNVSGEVISFKIYDATNEQEEEVITTVTFSDGSQVGTNTQPQFLTNVHVWNGSSWDSGNLPATGAGARLSANYNTTSGNLDVDYLDVQNDVTLTINPQAYVKVKTELNNQGTVHVKPGGSLLTLGSITGDGFQIDRITTFDQNTGRYSVVGSPIEEASFSLLGSQALIYAYDESAAYNTTGNTGLDRFKTPAQMGESTMQKGKGYFSAFTGDEKGEVTFEGKINSGTILIPLSYTNHGDASEVDHQGYNLVANPYPAPISYQSFISENSATNMDETIYLWDDFGSENGRGTNQDYLVVNATLGNTDSRSDGENKWDGFIRSGQGFFVKANTSTNLIFTDDMKESGNNDDAGFFRQSKVERYKLKLEGKGRSKAIILGFLSDATPSKDWAYDALALSNADFQFYSTNPEGNKLAIQGLPKRYEEPVSLMLQTRETGTYSMSIMNLQEVNNSVWLYDKITSQYVDLSVQAYDFNVSSPGYSDRFLISREKEALALKEHRNWNAYISNSFIKVEQQRFSTTKQYKLVSLAGHTIISSTVDDVESWFVGDLPSGLYLISDDIHTQKIFVE
ncbi:MAG: hypothetical protein RIA69_01430 [Cyclobacteriaceae bacterium]